MRKLASSVLMMIAVLGLGASQAFADASGDVTLVKIHADWCGTCLKLQDTWKDLKVEYGENVQFVVFDVTDKGAVAASRAEAERRGMVTVFDRYKSRTGTIAVVRNSTGEAVQVLKGEFDAAKYAAAIEKARQI